MEQINVEMKRQDLSMQVDRAEFALALKTWRLRSAKTQQEVATAWGCSRYTIIRAEKGKPITWEMAYKMFARLSEELRKENGHG